MTGHKRQYYLSTEEIIACISNIEEAIRGGQRGMALVELNILKNDQLLRLSVEDRQKALVKY